MNIRMQAAFDRAASKLLAQGRRATCDFGPFSKAGTWFGSDGTRCALAWLVPDDATAGSWDGVRIAEYGVKTYNLPADFIKRIMDIHDHYHPECWRDAFRHLAKSYGLNTAVLDKTDFPPESWSDWAAKLGVLPPEEELVKVRVPKAVSFAKTISEFYDELPEPSTLWEDKLVTVSEAKRYGYQGYTPYFAPFSIKKNVIGELVACW